MSIITTTAARKTITPLGITAALIVVSTALTHPVFRTAPQRAAVRAATDSVTFNRHIAPILFNSCAACHRPGGVAPFSLLTYHDAASRADIIAAATHSRRMPPWLPEPGKGNFLGARRLSDEQIALFRQWVDDGLVEGDPADLPRAPSWSHGWQLGEPDLTVSLPEPYTLHGRGPEVFRNFVMRVPISGRRYVKAVELRSTNYRVLHHAMIMVDPTPAARNLDAKDPEPGFDGMLSLGNAEMPEGFFLGWAPGRLPSRAPEGMAWILEEGTDLVVQFHLRPRPRSSGEPETISGTVGFYFTDQPPVRRATALRLGVETIDITPGDSNYTITDEYTLPVDVEVLGVLPHAHYLAKEMKGFARLPDGSIEWLLHIRDWDFNQQDAYRYATPVYLPRGTALVMEYSYDNTSGNPHNPNSPPRRVVYGGRSVDEMGELWLQVAAVHAGDFAVLRRHWAAARLERRIAGLQQTIRTNPDHPTAHGGLGEMLLILNRFEAAATHYRRHLEINPGDGNAHYNLAVSLQAGGHAEEAADPYRATIRLIPSHVDARNGLGNALLSLGNVEEAIHWYRETVRIAPTFAEAHNNLGMVLSALARFDQALHHAREAARLRPDWAPPLMTMAWILATHPDRRIRLPDTAIAHAARAAELTGRRDPEVLNVLAAAYAAGEQFTLAVRTAGEALALASAAGAADLVAEIESLLLLYRTGKAYIHP